MNLAGKVIVVTGAGSGMGREIALELSRKNVKVALVDFREKTLAETAALIKEVGGTCSTHVLDVADAKAVAALPAAVIKKMPGNNMGNRTVKAWANESATDSRVIR